MLGKHSILLALAPIAFSADYQIEANIRYSNHPETVLDIVQSPAPALKNRPGVMVIHGEEGGKESIVERFCVPLVQHDFVVANVEYRQANAEDDVREAAGWFRKHADRFKVDSNVIVVMGEAAGGGLALMLGMRPASADIGPAIKLSAVIDFYGPSDGAITYIRRGLPPILINHGDADHAAPYDQSVRLTKELKTSGNEAELITVPGGPHVFEPPEMARVWPQIFKWLKKRKIGS